MHEGAAPTLVDCGFIPEDAATISSDQAARLAACIDARTDALDAGELPTLWHWGCFAPHVATAGLGDDGHPERRAEMDEFSRRMWVGGRIEVVQPLTLDEVAHRSSRVVSASLKDGSRGRYWFVTVAHEISQGDVNCVQEEQDLVLRKPSDLQAPGPDREDAPAAEWVEELEPGPVLLFRFSAVIHNAHRIHYDQRYAMCVEGYPDVVVQAPLTALLLAEMARRRTGRLARLVSFRARAPLYANRRVWLTGNPAHDGTAELAAYRADHVAAMTLQAR